MASCERMRSPFRSSGVRIGRSFVYQERKPFSAQNPNWKPRLLTSLATVALAAPSSLASACWTLSNRNGASMTFSSGTRDPRAAVEPPNTWMLPCAVRRTRAFSPPSEPPMNILTWTRPPVRSSTRFLNLRSCCSQGVPSGATVATFMTIFSWAPASCTPPITATADRAASPSVPTNAIRIAE
jgi:hypothetical protein